MKYIKTVITAILLALLIGSFSHAKPVLPTLKKSEIPEDIPEDVKKEIKQLYSKSLLERRGAVLRLDALGEKAKAAVPYLMDMLGTNEKIVSITTGNGVNSDVGHLVGEDIAKALANIGEPSLMPLLEALKDEDPYKKRHAAHALSIMKDTRAVKPLIDALDSDDGAVRRYVSNALFLITGTDLKEDKEKWLEWWKENKDKLN